MRADMGSTFAGDLQGWRAAVHGAVSSQLSAAGSVRAVHFCGICRSAKTSSAAAGTGLQPFTAGSVSGTAVSQLVLAAPVELFQPAQLPAPRAAGPIR